MMRDETRLGWAIALPALSHCASRSFRFCGRSGSRCICTICGCPGSAGRSSGPRTTSRRCPMPRFWGALAHTSCLPAVDSHPRARARPGARARGEWRVPRARASSARPSCCRGPFRPWSAALVWRFMFESPAGPREAVLVERCRQRLRQPGSRTRMAAWVPLVLADVWKTTPFVAAAAACRPAEH